MKPKKTKKANLENLRTIFFQIGMILTLTAILFAFEWTTTAKFQAETYKINSSNYEVIEIPPIQRKEKKLIKPPVPMENIIIEKDDVIIEDPLDLIDDGVDWSDPIIPVFEEEQEEIDEPVPIAEFMPTFKGKDGNYFRNYVANNVRFPEEAINNSISGTVYVSFVVDKDGSVSDVEILRGVHRIIDKAVLDVIKNSPRWEPGLNNGKFVRVKYSIAIAFRLE